MQKHAKGYPYREKKKDKTTFSEDKRPHLTQRRSWWKSEEKPIEREERAFYVPNIRVKSQNGKTGFRWCEHYQMDVWTVQEAHTLIDMWAQISWGRYSAEHKAMSKRARYFRKLWAKQKGRCAISGIQLEGAPGCGPNGIGIDIINHSQGVRKGNLRLVSAPIAITRLKYPEFRTQQTEQIDPANYEKWPIFFAVLKHFQWWLKEQEPFKNLPVSITFPVPTLKNQQADPKPKPWVEFEWTYYYPGSNTVTAWEEQYLNKQSSKFGSVTFRDDFIYIEVLKEKHPRHSWQDQEIIHDYKIPLCDPTIDFNKQIIKWIMPAFDSLSRSLARVGENW